MIAVVLGLAAGAIFYTPYAERKLAEEAVSNVAGGAAMTKIVKASWGTGSTLWCAILDRPDGPVAVTTHHGRIPFMEEVTEVAPNWVGLQSRDEYRMLEACREILASRPPALP